MIWLDAHISPRLAPWLESRFELSCRHVRDLGFLHASDEAIFQAAKTANAIILIKDTDFPQMILRLGPPPRAIWLRCGNTTLQGLQSLLDKHLGQILDFLNSDESIVEIV